MWKLESVAWMCMNPLYFEICVILKIFSHISMWFTQIWSWPGAFTIWMEFPVAFSGQMELHLHFEINWTVSFVRMPVGRGLGTYHVNKKHGGWTSYRARRFIGRVEKLGFFTRRRQFLLSSCCSIHISSGKPAIFPRCSSGGSTLECERKTQVPTTKRNSFSPTGLQLCSKTSANTTDEQGHT